MSNAVDLFELEGSGGGGGWFTLSLEEEALSLLQLFSFLMIYF